MEKISTIQLKKSTINQLKKVKEYPRQSYNEIISKMTINLLNQKKRNQYDEFLHKIQQEKMKEVWDNKVDEAWENA
tara:strand:+ start:4018 stop:4245 length:228 start_codon:yes stop_codon:yes gene_type:complete